jgi:DNA modification methylase
MTTSDLGTRTIEITALTPDPQNVRTHDAKNLQAIADSLRTFGQRKPIVTAKSNDGTLVVIAGNGTLEAAKALGWTHITIAEVPEDWDADKARAYAIADNRSAELADWDQTALTSALLDLDAVGYDMKMLGFDPSTMDEADDVVQDEVPALEDQGPTRTALGQLWIMGENRLMVGDSTNAEHFARLMGSDQADCVFTDPPYNVNYEGGTDDALKIENDNMSDADFAKFLEDAYTLMFQHTKEGGGIYVCHSDTGGGVFRSKMLETGWYLKQCLIWVKDTFVLGRQDYHWQHEPILYGWKPGAAHSWYGRRIRATVLESDQDIRSMKKQDLVDLLLEIAETSTIIREPKPRRNAEHPTMKPVPLVARMVANSTTRGDLVIDPFGGSGSTLIACAQMDRRCYTIEFDPRYADVILNRWEQLTGQTAVLAGEGDD